MPIYTGKSSDGSDAHLVEGVYVNPDNPDEWSNQPYNKHQKRQRKLYNMYSTIHTYMSDNHLTLDEILQQILNKTCNLNRSLREYVLSHYDVNGNFKY